MDNQELVNYIQKRLLEKEDEIKIEKDLEKVGWDYADIVEALTIAKKKIKFRKLLMKYIISIIIVISLFVALHFITEFSQSQSVNFKTSETISIMNSTTKGVGVKINILSPQRIIFNTEKSLSL
ncbi:MAG: hypothetical protein PWP03_69 [Candidatus Woesearchaeota archaeon]|nr:hypothetical protein [Candidatus Woesearchaeota archaeon]MDN5327431.1 hypothetical protein [Candidatus Woesearchaeota archaeon]